MNEAHTQAGNANPSDGRTNGNAGHQELRPVYMNVRSTPAVKDALLRIAREEKRSLSYVLHRVLADWLERTQGSQGREQVD